MKFSSKLVVFLGTAVHVASANKAVVVSSAVAAVADQHPVKHLLRRFLEDAEWGQDWEDDEEDEEWEESAGMDLDMGDFSCLMSGATDAESCQENGCVWCPIGSFTGACVTSEQGDLVNDLEVPHTQCGEPVSPEDEQFWGSLIGCEMSGTTEEGCLNTSPACTWCVVADPAFGICLTTELLDLANDMEDPNESIKVSDILDCSNEERGSDVDGIVDFSCFMFSAFGVDACLNAADAAGNACIFQEVSTTGSLAEMAGQDLCISTVQDNLYVWAMGMMDSYGLDMDSILPVSVSEANDFGDGADDEFVFEGGDEMDDEEGQDEVDDDDVDIDDEEGQDEVGDDDADIDETDANDEQEADGEIIDEDETLYGVQVEGEEEGANDEEADQEEAFDQAADEPGTMNEEEEEEQETGGAFNEELEDDEAEQEEEQETGDAFNEELEEELEEEEEQEELEDDEAEQEEEEQAELTTDNHNGSESVSKFKSLLGLTISQVAREQNIDDSQVEVALDTIEEEEEQDGSD